MSKDNDLTKAYEALNKKYLDLRTANEKLAANYEELQSAEEELILQNAELISVKEILYQNELLLKESQRVAQIGHYIFSITGSTWESSEMLKEIFGIDQSYICNVNGWAQIIHPSYREDMLEYLNNHVIAHKKKFDKEYKIIRVSDQRERWVHGLGSLKCDESGDPYEMFGVIQDITEQKQIEESLAESNERLKFAMEGSNDGLWDLQLKTGIVYISPRGCEILGYNSGELDKDVNTWSEMIHPDDLILNNECFRSHLKGETPLFETEQRFRMKSGDWKWIFTKGKLIQIDKDGSPLRMTGTFTDISDRKNAELALSHSYLMSYIIEHNKSGVAVFDKDMRYIYVSQRYLSEYRLKDHSIIGKHHYEVFPDLPERWKIVHQRALQGEVFSKEEDIYYREDGTVDWTKWECRPWYQADGSTGGIIIYTDVINEKKHTDAIMKEQELLLHEKKEELNTFFDNAIDLLSISDLEGHFLRLNKEWEVVLGYSLEDMEGQKYVDFIHPDDVESTLKKIEQLSNQIDIINLANRYRCKDGSYRWIEWRSTQKGNRIYSSARDITERKIAEIQLKEKTDEIEAQNKEYKQINDELFLAKEKAVESDRLKTAFLQNMSHEIRTPMNAIVGFSELLSLNFNDKQKLERFSGIITQRCNDLLDIINDLLEIAKIEAGQLPVKIQKCNIRILLYELTLFFEEYLKKQKKQHITLNICPDYAEEDIWAFTDMVKLKQIFINLIGNAIKFTNKGSIEVGFFIDTEKYITFYVKDTGIGIAKDKQQLIFERFTQIDNGPHRLYGGTGLGLSIVSGLLNLLGGRIWLDSEPGKGSSFYFTIPRDVSNTREIEQDKSEITSSTIQHHNKSILIVEDDQFNAEYIKEVLSNKGLHLIFASSGNEAVEMTLAHMPDLILMDIGLPDISGFEAIQKIKELRPDTKIIAQTAYALEDDRVKAMQAGCIDYISKPLKSELFLPMINKHLK